MTRSEMALFEDIRRTIARQTYVESLTNLLKLGYIEPDEYRAQLQAINAANGFTVKASFWTRDIFKEEKVNNGETVQTYEGAVQAVSV